MTQHNWLLNDASVSLKVKHSTAQHSFVPELSLAGLGLCINNTAPKAFLCDMGQW